MTVSRQSQVLGLALLGLLALGGCAKGASTLDDTANGGGAGATGTGGMGMTGTGGMAATMPCGNGMIDMGEECDGTMFKDGATCMTMGFTGGGTLMCDPNTCRFQISMCKMAMPMGMGGNGQ
jgi:hypothetical protein